MTVIPVILLKCKTTDCTFSAKVPFGPGVPNEQDAAGAHLMQNPEHLLDIEVGTVTVTPPG